MTIVTKKHLSRRTLLQGIGTAISLPLLDSMIPALTAQTKTAANVVPRAGFIYVPHGAVMDKWTPVGTGADFEFGPILSPLAKHRDNVIVLSNLCHHQAEALGDGGADHSRATATWLNGVHAKKTEGEDVRAGTTVDQMAAEKIGQETRFPSLEIATEDMTGLIGACDVGYSCAYMNTISWRTPTTPLPMEINPRVVFERLFGGDGATAEQRAARLKDNLSLLDGIAQSAKDLSKTLDARDKVRLSDYLENVREIERRIEQAEKKHSDSEIAAPDTPAGVPDSYEEHVKLLYDLWAIAFQGDITRVTTFMMARELSTRTYPQIGVPDGHHPVSHHQNVPERMDQHAKINTYHIGLFAGFLDKLRNTPDGNGNLLDHSMILYGSGMSNGNVHSHDILPALIAGGAAGRMKGNLHVKAPLMTPLSNLLVAMLDKAGIAADRLGDSSGRIDIG